MLNSLMSLGIKPRAQRAAAGTANKAITLTNVVESLGMIANTAGAAMLSVFGETGPTFQLKWRAFFKV